MAATPPFLSPISHQSPFSCFFALNINQSMYICTNAYPIIQESWNLSEMTSQIATSASPIMLPWSVLQRCSRPSTASHAILKVVFLSFVHLYILFPLHAIHITTRLFSLSLTVSLHFFVGGMCENPRTSLHEIFPVALVEKNWHDMVGCGSFNLFLPMEAIHVWSISPERIELGRWDWSCFKALDA